MGNRGTKHGANPFSEEEAPVEIYNVKIVDCQQYIFQAIKNLLTPVTDSPSDDPKYRRIVHVEGRKISIIISFLPKPPSQWHQTSYSSRRELVTKSSKVVITEDSFTHMNAVIVCAESKDYQEHMKKIAQGPYPPSIRLLVGREDKSNYEDLEHGFTYYRTADHVDGVIKVVIGCTLELLLMGQMTKGARR